MFIFSHSVLTFSTKLIDVDVKCKQDISNKTSKPEITKSLIVTLCTVFVIVTQERLVDVHIYQ